MSWSGQRSAAGREYPQAVDSRQQQQQLKACAYDAAALPAQPTCVAAMICSDCSGGSFMHWKQLFPAAAVGVESQLPAASLPLHMALCHCHHVMKPGLLLLF